MTTHWQFIDRDGRLRRAQYQADMGKPYCTVVAASAKQYVAFSPGKGQAAAVRATLPADAELILLAPSLGHSLGLREWKQEFPQARVFAAEAAIKQLSRVSGIEGIAAAETLQAALPEGLTVHIPPGSSLAEVWLRVVTGDTHYWLMCDAFTNLDQLGSGFLSRFLLRLYGLRKGLVCHRVFARGIADKSAFRHWALAQFAESSRIAIVPCHGEVEDSADCLAKVREILSADFPDSH